MRHLINDDIEKYLLQGESALSSDKRSHLNDCIECRELLEEQKGIHKILYQIQPMILGKDLYDKINARLEPRQIEHFIDSLFIPAFILLFIIGLFLFSTKIYKDPASSTNSHTITQNKNIDDKLSWNIINYQTNKVVSNFLFLSKKYNKEMLFALFVLLVFFFYSTIDKYLNRKLQ